MGTPKEAPFSPFSIITDNGIFFRADQIDIPTWKALVNKALFNLRPLKEVSGFSPIVDYFDIEIGRTSGGMTERQTIDIDNVDFRNGLGPDSLCRQMAVVSSVRTGRSEKLITKNELRLFLLKNTGDFAVLAGTYAFSTIPTAEWRAMDIKISLLALDDLNQLSEALTEPEKFWMRLFLAICALSDANYRDKKARLERARGPYEVKRGMKSRIVFPEGLIP